MSQLQPSWWMVRFPNSPNCTVRLFFAETVKDVEASLPPDTRKHMIDQATWGLLHQWIGVQIPLGKEPSEAILTSLPFPTNFGTVFVYG